MIGLNRSSVNRDSDNFTYGLPLLLALLLINFILRQNQEPKITQFFSSHFVSISTVTYSFNFISSYTFFFIQLIFSRFPLGVLTSAVNCFNFWLHTRKENPFGYLHIKMLTSDLNMHPLRGLTLLNCLHTADDI